ncbi:hypothetical protein PYH37_005161 [Sinorhizobium numidicum]|uniref:Uncharacterized protein n=1 Tax=Sinorhizobium numidicum TaxID=680248 RepID=A0ABY8CXV5_9HYPH|nr:hypothetical protein [Sinorhizobium numidicum]WEX76817.1 hypothetical protein PYH37_005161 [Sinorhizobium numidicum]WEX83478.1 hypothetical protein PYH38_002254 [Sinorhizobium numidicum]
MKRFSARIPLKLLETRHKRESTEIPVRMSEVRCRAAQENSLRDCIRPPESRMPTQQLEYATP